MKYHHLLNGKVLVCVATQRELSEAFCRMEEFYESPTIAGQVLTKDAVLLEYLYRTGESYFEWEGFNVPVRSVLSWAEDAELEPVELEIVSNIEDATEYIIGVMPGDNETYHHEMSHAMFALDDDYKRVTSGKVPSDKMDWLRDNLKNSNYSTEEGLVVDETVAYSVGGWLEVFPDDLQSMRQEIRSEFEKTMAQHGIPLEL